MLQIQYVESKMDSIALPCLTDGQKKSTAAIAIEMIDIFPNCASIRPTPIRSIISNSICVGVS